MEAVTFHAQRLRGIGNLKSLFGQFSELLILKVAVSLFNMARMDTNATLFANVEAGRSWPFVKD